MYSKSKRKPKIILAAFACAFALIASILLSHGTSMRAQSASVGAAGSPADPLVTASYVSRYVREAVDAAMSEINEALANLSANAQAGQTQHIQQPIITETPQGFEVIRLTQNQRVHAVSGTVEIILRPGAIVTVRSFYDVGIADITTGQELLHGDFAPINHLLIIPRADTRGITVHSEVAYALVRGDILISD